MKNFALIGAAGYIAPRHMKAIKDTGNNLVAILDPHDNVGVIDSYFPNADYFREFERFDRHLDKLRRMGEKIDYVSVCSPNYLHDSHIRFGLRHHADVICEKPLVLNPWNVDALSRIESETRHRINAILQLRLHSAIQELKKEFNADTAKRKRQVSLDYVTSRGNWYQFSWKGDVQKSGGVATNIGIHFFDMLTWIFGETIELRVDMARPDKCRGTLELKYADVEWFLSLDSDDLPREIAESGQPTYRSIVIDGLSLEFSEGFTNLHTKSYETIIAGNGFGLDDARQSIEIVHQIREMG